jgi:hypothetical protein
VTAREVRLHLIKDDERKIASSMSKAGLIALACSLKVIRWDSNIIIGLPSENRPEYIAEKIFNCYLEIKRSGK